MSSTRRPQRTGELDNYQTPTKSVDTLLSFLLFYDMEFGGKRWLEPCRGVGRITTVFRRYFDSTEWCELSEGTNYLKADLKGRKYDWIITNPPFSLALQFLSKSLAEAESVAYLLRLNFLGSQKRRPFWQAFPPDALLVLSERPCFTENGKTDSIEYAWFIWSKRVPGGIYVR
jgi:hypothetical protein